MFIPTTLIVIMECVYVISQGQASIGYPYYSFLSWLCVLINAAYAVKAIHLIYQA